MNLIKRNDLLRVYEQNLSREDKTEISQLLNYAQASGLKSYLKRKPDAYLLEDETKVVNDFFAFRGGFQDQLVLANKKLEKHDFETKETQDLIEVIKVVITKIQGISDTDYLAKVKESLEVATTAVDTQIKINNLR